MKTKREADVVINNIRKEDECLRRSSFATEEAAGPLKTNSFNITVSGRKRAKSQ